VGVIIIRDMVGTSPRSWSDAARQAVATASKTVRNIQTVDVVRSWAIVEDGEIVEYRVEVKIGFEYDGLAGSAGIASAEVAANRGMSEAGHDGGHVRPRDLR
jgi:flavin-binding protein dodecin